MAPNLGVSTTHFALIASLHNNNNNNNQIPLSASWNEVIEKENMSTISFNPIDKTFKWNEVNKPVKHCIKIISKQKKTWNDLNSTESTSLFNVDKKKRADNIQSNSINLSVLPKEKLGIDKSFLLYSDTFSYTPKKKNYNQMNISELRLSFNNNTTRKQWNDVCNQYKNDNFCMKQENHHRQSERSVEHIQKFTVKSMPMLVSPYIRSTSMETNEKLSPCQEISLQTNQIKPRKWNDICNQYSNDNFCVKKILKPQNEKSVEQLFTLSQCQKYSLEHQSQSQYQSLP